MSIFYDKLLIKTDCDAAVDCVLPNVLSPRDQVFRSDIGHKLYPSVISLKLNGHNFTNRKPMELYLPFMDIEYMLPCLMTINFYIDGH